MKTLFESQFLFDFDEILPTEARTYVVFWDYFKIFFGSTDFKCSWFKHKLKLFVFKCTIIVLYFWRSKFSFVLKSWTPIKIIDYKFMLKLQCKTTFNSVFVGKKNHQNRTRVDFGIMFFKNVVLHEIYSKKSVTEYVWHVCRWGV
jgi:hypothetical protein